MTAKPLRPEQARAAAMLGRGYPQVEAAKAVNRNPRTIRTWLTRPQFQAAVQASRDQLLSEQPDAESVLRSVMLDPLAPVNARVSAARALLIANRDGPPEPDPTPETWIAPDLA